MDFTLVRLLQRLARFPGNARTAGNAALLFNLVADTGRKAARGEHHHVRSVDSAFLLGDATLDLLLRIRARVTLDHLHAFDENAARALVDFENPSGLALVLSRNHLHGIVLLDADADGLRQFLLVAARRSFALCHLDN